MKFTDRTSERSVIVDVRHERRVHNIARIEIHSGIPFAEFVSALEAAAPEVDRAEVERIQAAGGSWDDVRAAAAQNAPHDLMTYAKIDASGYFSLAGHDTPAIEYLIGNHVIAETMFRHDPRAMLYAPLRMLVFGDAEGNAVFTMDQPGSTFGSLGHPDIDRVGADLDQKVLALLRIVGVDVGASFD